MTLIETEPDFEYTNDDRVVEALYDLKQSVVGAFRQHDRDLRSEVEKVNTQIRGLIVVVGVVGLLLAAANYNSLRVKK